MPGKVQDARDLPAPESWHGDAAAAWRPAAGELGVAQAPVRHL